MFFSRGERHVKNKCVAAKRRGVVVKSVWLLNRRGVVVKKKQVCGC